jgi:hypothetical protein
VRDQLGHRHLGFRPEQITRLLTAAGFASSRVEDLPQGPGQPFRVLVATAVKAPRRGAGRQPGAGKRAALRTARGSSRVGTGASRRGGRAA